MKSRTKYDIDSASVKKLISGAGFGEAEDISPLGAGEYNTVFSARAKGREYAVKIAPCDVPVQSYEKGMMASEVFWYKQIRERTNITVPEIYHTDFTKEIIPADYFIMDKLPGRQPDDMQFTEAEKAGFTREMAMMAAQIHKIKNDRFGYIQNKLYDDWHQAISAMVKSLLNDCARKGRKSKRGEKLLVLIDKYKAILQKSECCMVNFDLWPSNILCRRENENIHYAWIDPERSFWGDRIADFVCLEVMTPLAEKSETLLAYNSVADSPVNVTDEEKIRYAVAQGYLGLILEVEKYYRYTPLHYGWWRNVFAAKMFFSKAFGSLA